MTKPKNETFEGIWSRFCDWVVLYKFEWTVTCYTLLVIGVILALSSRSKIEHNELEYLRRNNIELMELNIRRDKEVLIFLHNMLYTHNVVGDATKGEGQ